MNGPRPEEGEKEKKGNGWNSSIFYAPHRFTDEIEILMKDDGYFWESKGVARIFLNQQCCRFFFGSFDFLYVCAIDIPFSSIFFIIIQCFILGLE